MPRVYCPDCDARFTATGRRAECPDCGYRFTVSAADEREERRGRRAKYSSGKNLVPLLIVGGAVAVVVLFGVVGVVIYTVVSRARDQVRRPNVATAPVSTPAVNPMPVTNDPPPQAQTSPPQGRSNTMPGGRNANTTQPPGPNNGTQPPPQNRQPAAPGQLVTLTNLRRGGGRGFGPPSAFSVDYEYAAGTSPGIFDVLVVASGGERVGEVDLIGPRPRADTISVRSFGPAGGRLNGSIEVWMERKTSPGPFGGRGQKISNSLTLN